MRSPSVFLLLCLATLPAGAATFTVSNTNNSGAGSLRQAILDANANASAPHFIHFSLSETEAIQLTAALPALTRSTQLNIGSGVVVIDYAGSGCLAEPLAGLELRGEFSVVENVSVRGCFFHGIRVAASASNSELRGVETTGSGGNGVLIEAAGTALVRSSLRGNRITNAGQAVSDGQIELGSAIRILDAANVRVRGTLAGSTTVDGNRGAGIFARNAHGLILGLDAAGTVIEADRNSIGGNRASGIVLVSSNEVAIRGNRIGTGVFGAWPRNGRGTADLDAGIQINGGAGGITGLVIGGNGEDRGNLIINTRGHGIYMTQAVTGAVIEANRIGAPEATLSAPNSGDGMFLNLGPNAIRIGDFAPSRHNLIASNGGAGIRMNGAATTDNRIFANSIFGNTGGGIVVSNGAQAGAATPTIASIVPGSPNATVSGTANADGLVQVYADNGSQGRFFLGTALANGSGAWTLVANLDAHAGRNLTATSSFFPDATRVRTSGFSAPFAVPGASFFLTVSKAGSGTGLVTSSPAGIHCGSTCENPFANGSVVTLTASADPGSVFAGWSGSGCTGTGTCVLTMSQARSVTATFAPAGALIFADGFGD
jgi:hypothetical protein